MPGYISLFHRFEYDPKNLKSQDIEDEFNEIFNTIEKAQRDKKYRKRPVNTVWTFFGYYILFLFSYA